jgi:hypothetical protein
MRCVIIGFLVVVSGCILSGCSARPEPLNVIEPTFSYARDGSAVEFAAKSRPIDSVAGRSSAPIKTLSSAE